MSNQTFVEEVDLLLGKINEIIERDVRDHITHMENGDIFPSMGNRGRWRDETLIRIKPVLEFYNYYKEVSRNQNVYSFLTYFQNLYEKIEKLFSILFDPTSRKDLNLAFEEVNKQIDEFEKLKGIPFYFSPTLKREDFISIHNEIRTIRPNFDVDDVVVTIYDSSNEESKKDIFTNLINIRNIARIETPTLDDGVELQKSFDKIFNRSEIDEAKELVSEVKEISETFKSNVTKETNKEILNTFSTTTDRLETEIKKLNNWIIFLFCSIMLMLSTKVFLILFMEDKFKDIYNFLLFLTLILSCSALLTYFIKEKNHLRKLYDFYLMKGLELNALPGYMNELTPEQRRTLIVQLAPVYFLGDRDTKNPTTSTEGNDIKTIGGLVTELGKMIKELKP